MIAIKFLKPSESIFLLYALAKAHVPKRDAEENDHERYEDDV